MSHLFLSTQLLSGSLFEVHCNALLLQLLKELHNLSENLLKFTYLISQVIQISVLNSRLLLIFVEFNF